MPEDSHKHFSNSVGGYCVARSDICLKTNKLVCLWGFFWYVYILGTFSVGQHKRLGAAHQTLTTELNFISQPTQPLRLSINVTPSELLLSRILRQTLHFIVSLITTGFYDTWPWNHLGWKWNHLEVWPNAKTTEFISQKRWDHRLRENR